MDKILEGAFDTIRKRFGEGAIIRLGDKPLESIEVIPIGCPSIDNALGIGGIPRGRIVEIYGPEGSGKTTFAIHAIAEAQAQGGVAAFIDVEHAFDAGYASQLGVKTDDLFVAQPDCGEQALETAELLAQSGKVSLIVIDSVAALVTQAEINGEMGDAVVGQQARLMSQACRKLTPVLSKTKTSLLFINQLREKIGVTWGSPETTSGGKALKFYASMRIDIRRIGSVKDGNKIIGNRTKIKTVKNRFAPPFREIELDLIFGEGFSKESDLLDVAIDQGIIKKSGVWFSFNDLSFQGREKIRLALKDKELFNTVKSQI